MERVVLIAENNLRLKMSDKCKWSTFFSKDEYRHDGRWKLWMAECNKYTIHEYKEKAKYCQYCGKKIEEIENER